MKQASLDLFDEPPAEPPRLAVLPQDESNDRGQYITRRRVLSQLVASQSLRSGHG
jgi:hypothetical protein